MTGLYSTTVGPGRALGSNYLLQQEIGGGASGRVWRGVRRQDGSAVAIKVLRAEFASDTDSVVRFLRQRTVLPSVTHPHLVHVHDLVAEGDVLAVVMDLVEGPDLRQVIRESPLTRDQAKLVLAQIAAALAAVHAAGVVHRDVKPENVLIRWHEGRPWAMLTDLGLAKAMESPVYTTASQLHGTPAYLAPEVVTGRPAGPESDVYALSVMAYELLAGERPVRADNPAALLLAHLEAQVSRPPTVDNDEWRLLRAGLAKDPVRRPTAEEFAARMSGAPAPVEDIAQPTYGTGAQTASTLDAIRPAQEKPKAPKKRRKRWMVWTAAAVCVVLGGGAGVLLGQPDKKAQEPPKPAIHPVFLAVTATSPKPGEVRLEFQNAKQLPGFQSYLVYMDKSPILQIETGDETFYSYSTEDHATEHCFEVAALLLTDKPPVLPVSKPACLPANGKHK